MKSNNIEAVSVGLLQQKTHPEEVLLMETLPLPQGDFSDFQQPI